MLFPEIREHLAPSFPELFGGWQDQKPLEQDSKSVMVYALRHTTTDIDKQDKSHGWMNIPLNAKGIVEAKEMADTVGKSVPTRIVSSDLLRSLMTAQFLANKTGLNVEPNPGLRPLNTGIYSGLDADIVHRETKQYFDNPNVKIPGGESINDFQNRNLSTIRQVLSEAKAGDKVVLMGHSITPRLLQAYARNKNLEPIENLKSAIAKHGEPPLVNVFKFDPKTAKLEAR